MHAGRYYTFKEIVAWTRRETVVFVLVAALPTTLYVVAGWHWLMLPWLPVAAIGTAVAFMTGFKNNASYSRLWEARQVWGGIVNASRSWALLVLDSVPEAAIRQRLIYRHLAWLTALRYQLRERRVWENMQLIHNVEYLRRYEVAEWDGRLEHHLAPLVAGPELEHVLARKNRALHLLERQAQDAGALLVGTEYRRIEVQRQLGVLLDAQGRCERIKNFPYPRQYATLNHIFVWLFIVLAPYGLLPEFHKLGGALVWLNIPACAALAWVFHTMDKIGNSSENPFEGSPNDVPVTAMCRGIEIDLREMLGETDLPPAVAAVNQILM